MSPEQRAPDLAAAFARRRCRCGARAMSVRPGSDGISRILPAITDENWCLACLLMAVPTVCPDAPDAVSGVSGQGVGAVR